MKKGNLVVNMIVLLSLVLGLTGCFGGGKPSQKILKELATKSLVGVIYTHDSSKLIIDTPYGTHSIHTIKTDNPKFFNDFSVGENVKRKDKNNVEREMWAVDVFASAIVTYNEDIRLVRTEAVKYKMFVYKGTGDSYLFENGVLESFAVGEFGK